MKKLFVLAALAAPLFFFSCAKEMEPIQEESEAVSEAKIAFTASIESLESSTKADINAENKLVWAAGDHIGVFVDDGSWEVKNQSFVLVGDGGSTAGAFSWDVEPAQDFTNPNATVAFFPWNGTNPTTDNNVYDGYVYYKLPESYYGYTSGKMLTPLAATITRTGDAYNAIAFKHAGAAVKVTINNLPFGAHSIGMSVKDQQIRGEYKLALTNIGTEAMIVNDAQASYNTIWLNYAPVAVEGAFTFLFPVPTLTAPTLTFKIYDKNDAKIWEADAKTKSDVALGRGQVLAMPALTLSKLYKDYDQVSAWGVCGSHTGWSSDTPMVTEVDGNIHIADDIDFAAGAEFKIRKNGDYDKGEYNWNNIIATDVVEQGDGLNIKVKSDGTYDVILDTKYHKIKVVVSDIDYPDAEGMPHHSTIKKATNLGATETANCYVVRAAGKYKFPGVKGNDSSASVGDIKGVELLWETYNNGTSVTANSVIEAIDYDDEDNFVYFKTPDVLQPGNALIAAKDGEGNIIWSWHIWIPASTITDIGDYSVSKKYLMDRNLGAIVPAVKPDGDGTVDVRSVGLFYQWGRKDPFVGYKWGKSRIDIKVSGASGSNRGKSTTKVTIAQSIAAPTTLIQGESSARDWLKESDNTLWGHNASKTIYDPCPAGYRVPDRDTSDPLWQTVTDLAQFSSSSASTGHWWKLGNVVFPYSGYYYYSSGDIDGEYSKCYLWNAEAHSTAGYGQAQYVYDNSGTWASAPGWGLGKSSAAPVRCVKIAGEVLPPIPAGAKDVTLATDGSISSDWSKADAIADSNGGIKEWKYGYDATNLYFYFKIKRTSIIAAKTSPFSYRNRRYIYIALDTDNDPSEGIAPGYDLNLPGCEALALVFPFDGNATVASGTDGTLNIINGQDDQSWTKILSPSESQKDDNIYVYGNVTGNTSSDFVYIEMSVPRSGLGISSSFTGIMKVQFTLSGDTTAAARIELE